MKSFTIIFARTNFRKLSKIREIPKIFRENNEEASI